MSVFADDNVDMIMTHEEEMKFDMKPHYDFDDSRCIKNPFADPNYHFTKESFLKLFKDKENGVINP